MNAVFEKFLEILLVDAMYKLIDFNWLCLFWLMKIRVIKPIVKVFRMYNESWSKTHVIMSDKDLNKMDAFSKCFLLAQLLICFYQTLRLLKR